MPEVAKQAIRDYFAQLVDISDEDWAVFSSKLVRREFPKKTILLNTGQVENYLSYIEQGMTRFYIPKLDNDLTFEFEFETSWVSAYDSFLTQSPSVYNIETLADTVLWSISYEDFQYAYANTEIGNNIGRLAAEALFLGKSRRELSLLNDTAEERYMKLLTEEKHLIQQIPLKYLASYIGVTPQALSRIRKRTL